MKSAGLSTNQLGFAHYLAGLWGNQEQPVALEGLVPEAGRVGMLHCYRITRSRYWKPWRARVASPVQHWWCQSLDEAAHHYSWPDSLPPNSFSCIAGRLRQALSANDEGAARQACLDIFSWGGVAQKPTDKSRVWLEFQYGQSTLCQSIKQGGSSSAAGFCTQPYCVRWQRTFDERGDDESLCRCRPRQHHYL